MKGKHILAMLSGWGGYSINADWDPSINESPGNTGS